MEVEQKAGMKGKAEEAWVGVSRGGGVVAEPWLKTKNNGSLIPPRRRLVKKLMLDCILRFIASVFGAQGRPAPTSSAAAAAAAAAVIHGGNGQIMMVPQPNPKAQKNVSKILPHP